jgi:hypothetical protein
MLWYIKKPPPSKARNLTNQAYAYDGSSFLLLLADRLSTTISPEKGHMDMSMSTGETLQALRNNRE